MKTLTMADELRTIAAKASALAETMSPGDRNAAPLAIDVIRDLVPAGARLHASQAREGAWYWYLSMPVGWRPREGDRWLGDGYESGLWDSGRAVPWTPPYGPWSEPGEPREPWVGIAGCARGSHVVGTPHAADRDPLTCQRCGATREELPPSTAPDTKDAALRAGMIRLLNATARS